ncbi:hypothetical protein TrLO_g3454 [Triparma laevis f. longispina]|uniref:tRNA/rRNA methyltransferase SpoU type domain-containing protein n=1 Tax=Triparma laevis f. longispina TaxID=1714387 RepID=A0A9W6ZSU1_9STRA|nr:hypothetical protein TrLO_g3454 [Triparma laevis f. longispina]
MRGWAVKELSILAVVLIMLSRVRLSSSFMRSIGRLERHANRQHSPLFSSSSPPPTNSDRISLLHSLLPSSLPPSSFTLSNPSISPSAVKTYNTYIQPSVENLEIFLTLPPEKLKQAAKRTCTQIIHLQNHHLSHSQIRNRDPSTSPLPPSLPLTFLLLNLRSASNVGSIYRTSSALNCKIISCGYTPFPWNEKVKKVALGAEESVTFECFEGIEDVDLEEYWVVGLETVDGAVGLYDAKLKCEERKKDTLIILGNEVTGLPKEVLGRCDEIVEVPMEGFKNSLNVGVCMGVVGYEFLRREKYSERREK